MNIEFKGSSNFSSREGQKITEIIIHWFGVGTLESANTRFQNPANKSSAHYGISKGRIWQWVKEENTAWHAGNLSVNQKSIGIEHDATLNDHDLSMQDYQLSGQLIREIANRYKIPLDRAHIKGHKEIKPTQCPGTVDIDKIIKIAKEQNMTQFKTQNYKGELRIVLQAYSMITWEAICKVYGVDPKKIDEIIT